MWPLGGAIEPQQHGRVPIKEKLLMQQTHAPCVCVRVCENHQEPVFHVWCVRKKNTFNLK